MSLSRLAPRLLAAGALAITLAACGGVVTSTSEPGADTEAPADGDGVVTVQRRGFVPGELTVEAGDEVVWQWEQGVGEHDVTADVFASEIQASGTFTHVFEEPGTYDYRCSLHDGMTGTVTVDTA